MYRLLYRKKHAILAISRICFLRNMMQLATIFTVRKRSGSNKSLLCESEATATTNLYCAKAKRQQHISKKREGKDVK